MSSLSRRLPRLWMAAMALCAPVWTTAAEAASPSVPHRRAADPALVRTLQDHRWTLQSATGPGGKPLAAVMLPGHAFVVLFDQSRLAIDGGCNRMNGGWRLSSRGQLRVGRLASTMRACEPPLMQADSALGNLLARPLAMQVTPGAAPSLRLTTPAKHTLVFDGQPTPRSLFGVPERIFLEVAAQTAACQPGAGGPTQCLQVRERRYDEQGLRIDPPGDWQAFYSGIDGYTHTPGVRNVLRIHHYKRGQVPADASAYVYVLDIVIESETVSR